MSWNRVNFTSEQIDEMVRQWRDGASQHAIAQRLGLSQPTVSRVLRQHGIRPEARLARRERNTSWKGGRSITRAGYSIVMVDPDDPVGGPMRWREGYVPEHRLVLARHLGRPLAPSETVHHLNGDRMDNRIENLQLRNGRHGKGIAHRCLDCGSSNIEAVTLD